MSEGQGNEQIVDQGQGDGSSVADQSGTVNINPAWNDALNGIPQEFHSHLTPHFQQWDQNFQNKIQQVHSQYEPYKPFIEQGVTPEELNYGYGLLNALENNPQEVLAALQEAIAQENGQYDGGQGQYESTQQNPDQQQQFEIDQHPYVQQMREQMDIMAQILLGQREQEQQQAADEAFDQELTQLKETKGDFDEEYVIGLLLANPNMSTEEAVDRYQNLSQQILSGKRQPGPPVLGSGGAIPNSQADMRKASPKDTRAVVQQMLAQAAQQNQ